MKNTIQLTTLFLTATCLIACDGPKESRVQMDTTSNRTSDSLLNSIDSLMQVPENVMANQAEALHTNTYIFEYR